MQFPAFDFRREVCILAESFPCSPSNSALPNRYRTDIDRYHSAQDTPSDTPFIYADVGLEKILAFCVDAFNERSNTTECMYPPSFRQAVAMGAAISSNMDFYYAPWDGIFGVGFRAMALTQARSLVQNLAYNHELPAMITVYFERDLDSIEHIHMPFQRSDFLPLNNDQKQKEIVDGKSTTFVGALEEIKKRNGLTPGISVSNEDRSSLYLGCFDTSVLYDVSRIPLRIPTMPFLDVVPLNNTDSAAPSREGYALRTFHDLWRFAIHQIRVVGANTPKVVSSSSTEDDQPENSRNRAALYYPIPPQIYLDCLKDSSRSLKSCLWWSIWARPRNSSDSTAGVEIVADKESKTSVPESGLFSSPNNRHAQPDEVPKVNVHRLLDREDDFEHATWHENFDEELDLHPDMSSSPPPSSSPSGNHTRDIGGGETKEDILFPPDGTFPPTISGNYSICHEHTNIPRTMVASYCQGVISSSSPYIGFEMAQFFHIVAAINNTMHNHCFLVDQYDLGRIEKSLEKFKATGSKADLYLELVAAYHDRLTHAEYQGHMVFCPTALLSAPPTACPRALEEDKMQVHILPNIEIIVPAYALADPTPSEDLSTPIVPGNGSFPIPVVPGNGTTLDIVRTSKYKKDLDLATIPILPVDYCPPLHRLISTLLSQIASEGISSDTWTTWCVLYIRPTPEDTQRQRPAYKKSPFVSNLHILPPLLGVNQTIEKCRHWRTLDYNDPKGRYTCQDSMPVPVVLGRPFLYRYMPTVDSSKEALTNPSSMDPHMSPHPPLSPPTIAQIIKDIPPSVYPTHPNPSTLNLYLFDLQKVGASFIEHNRPPAPPVPTPKPRWYEKFIRYAGIAGGVCFALIGIAAVGVWRRRHALLTERTSNKGWMELRESFLSKDMEATDDQIMEISIKSKMNKDIWLQHLLDLNKDSGNMSLDKQNTPDAACSIVKLDSLVKSFANEQETIPSSWTTRPLEKTDPQHNQDATNLKRLPSHLTSASEQHLSPFVATALSRRSLPAPQTASLSYYSGADTTARAHSNSYTFNSASAHFSLSSPVFVSHMQPSIGQAQSEHGTLYLQRPLPIPSSAMTTDSLGPTYPPPPPPPPHSSQLAPHSFSHTPMSFSLHASQNPSVNPALTTASVLPQPLGSGAFRAEDQLLMPSSKFLEQVRPATPVTPTGDGAFTIDANDGRADGSTNCSKDSSRDEFSIFFAESCAEKHTEGSIENSVDVSTTSFRSNPFRNLSLCTQVNSIPKSSYDFTASPTLHSMEAQLTLKPSASMVSLSHMASAFTPIPAARSPQVAPISPLGLSSPVLPLLMPSQAPPPLWTLSSRAQSTHVQQPLTKQHHTQVHTQMYTQPPFAQTSLPSLRPSTRDSYLLHPLSTSASATAAVTSIAAAPSVTAPVMSSSAIPTSPLVAPTFASVSVMHTPVVPTNTAAALTVAMRPTVASTPTMVAPTMVAPTMVAKPSSAAPVRSVSAGTIAAGAAAKSQRLATNTSGALHGVLSLSSSTSPLEGRVAPESKSISTGRAIPPLRRQNTMTSLDFDRLKIEGVIQPVNLYDSECNSALDKYAK